MAQRPHYPQGRLGAFVRALDRPEQLATSGVMNHELVGRLRRIQDNGEESIAAIEEYDPNVCINLSVCTTSGEADLMLETWLSKRLDVLQRTRTELKQEWERSHGSDKPDVP